VAEALPPASEDAPLARARNRVMYAISILAVGFFLPFAVHDLRWGRYALGSAIVCVVLAFAADGLALHRGRKPPLPFALLLVPITAVITLSLATQGVMGAFWCYPTVLFSFFVLSRRMAIVCSLTLLAVATGFVLRFVGPRITIRFTVSLVLTILIVDVIQNIIRELERRLQEQAITDPLTGAFNRRHMEARLSEAVENARRGAAPASLLLIDIDHFKRINDEHGHDAGDAVLKGLVSFVRQRSRKVDLLFRMGGEEFVLLLPDTAEDEALVTAEDLRQSIAEAPLFDAVAVTVSIGIGGLRPQDSVEQWIKETDAAMYAAKQAGRNRVARRGAPEQAPAARAGSRP
jgi:diguanylate cyclase (GGDEF)-like protein